MKRPLLPALFVALIAWPLFSLAVDPASLPDIKKTKLGLYIEAKEVPDFLKSHPKVLFLDLRTPEELLFVGTPQGIDGNAPFGNMNYSKWDDKKRSPSCAFPTLTSCPISNIGQSTKASRKTIPFC